MAMFVRIKRMSYARTTGESFAVGASVQSIEIDRKIGLAAAIALRIALPKKSCVAIALS